MPESGARTGAPGGVASRAGRVLVVSFTDLARDPRVNRQIRFLRERFEVIAAGHGDPGVPGVGFRRLAAQPKPVAGRIAGGLRLLARRFESYYWARRDVGDCLERLDGIDVDLVVANDIEALPVALRIAGDTPVLFDAHEYAPREFDDQWRFRVLHRPYRQYLCNRYIPAAAGMTTVAESIADAYERDTGVRAAVVWNAPDHEPLEPLLREPGDETIRLVHHGGAMAGRRIELMIRMMRHLDERFRLDLMLVGTDPEYLAALEREAEGDERVRFRDPVPMRELARTLNPYDLGVYILEPTNFNNRHALPNKFFEFVQARLGVAIGPSPEMARLSREFGLGPIADDFSPRSLASLLSRLDRESVNELKLRAAAAARALSADASRETILALAHELVRSR